MKQLVVVWSLAIVCVPAFARAQGPPRPAAEAAAVDEGIPIDSPLVRARCGTCHKSDDKGGMARISNRRATPETWERTIKRMVALNHATLTPDDARGILKYLTDHNGLAPEELRPIAYEGERRSVEYSYTADETTANLCTSCHTMARVLSERRTKEEWELLIAMHRGYYPLVDTQPMNGGQGFMRSGGRGGRGGRGAEPRPTPAAPQGPGPGARPTGARRSSSSATGSRCGGAGSPARTTKPAST